MEKKGGEGEHPKARHNEEFKEHRYKKWGSRRNNYQQEKVWNKVGVIIENKFDALEEEEEKETTDEKGHQGEEKDKMIDENKVDKKRDINQSASSSSRQKDRQTESQSSIAGRGKIR
ncbi:hypothetical protein KY284_001418 [Solanum tuberosum]|nr:hypothetical protein KY284_001418 [Solanum tuberosum]